MKHLTPILRRIGHTDALIQGHDMSATLVAVALIAMLPGFGEHGVMISATIMCTLLGLLELPTGYFADRFGWRRSLQIAWTLTALALCCMITAAGLALHGPSPLIWIFIAAEAIIDAIALAFSSGAYQAAYQSLYDRHLTKHNIEQSTAPSLFLASYRYGIPIRIGLPLFAMALGYYLYSIYPASAIHPFLIYLPIVPLCFTLCITIFTLTHISRELKGLQGRASSLHVDWKLLKNVIGNTRAPLFSYSLCTFLRITIVLCLIGELYHLLTAMQLPTQVVWLGGMSCGLALRFGVMLVGRTLYHRLDLLRIHQRALRWALAGIGAASLTACAVMFMPTTPLFKFVSLVLFGMFGLVAADFIIRYVTSTVQRQIPELYRATWFSCTSVCGQLGFGLVTGLSLLVAVPYFGLSIQLGVVGAGAMTLLILHKQKKAQ